MPATTVCSAIIQAHGAQDGVDDANRLLDVLWSEALWVNSRLSHESLNERVLDRLE
jgi:hypothetical protein